MKTSKIMSILLAASMGFSGLAMANCADDAIDTCNAKHPNPNNSDHAYELYELCIKANLGQQCPNSAAVNVLTVNGFVAYKKPVLSSHLMRAASKKATHKTKKSRKAQ